MEMKLSGTRIKELRLKLSWSQEKLAEEAGLNPRTVQRAESEGSASLRTRLQLAEALRVPPEALDAQTGAIANIEARPAAASIHYLAILLIVTLIYVGAQPAYFSLSISKFAYELGSPWKEWGWWFMTFSLWALFSVPVLYYLRKKHCALFLPYVAAFSVGLGLAVLRVWQANWVAVGLTALTSLIGLALLLSLYLPRLDTEKLRHAVCMCLSVYVFIWCFHDLGSFAVSAYIGVRDFGYNLAETTPLWYVRGMILRNLGDLLQLIPVAPVLALSFGERPRLQWPVPAVQALPGPPASP